MESTASDFLIKTVLRFQSDTDSKVFLLIKSGGEDRRRRYCGSPELVDEFVRERLSRRSTDCFVQLDPNVNALIENQNVSGANQKRDVFSRNCLFYRSCVRRNNLSHWRSSRKRSGREYGEPKTRYISCVSRNSLFYRRCIRWKFLSYLRSSNEESEGWLSYERTYRSKLPYVVRILHTAGNENRNCFLTYSRSWLPYAVRVIHTSR